MRRVIEGDWEVVLLLLLLYYLFLAEVGLAIAVGAAHALGDVVTATVGIASRCRHHRLVAVQQMPPSQPTLLRLLLQLKKIDNSTEVTRL